MNRTDLIQRAVVAFLEYGCGAVVILLEQTRVRELLVDRGVRPLISSSTCSFHT